MQQRIKHNVECLILNVELEEQKKEKTKGERSLPLADFVGGQQLEGIPYALMDYLELVDWTGRAIRDDIGSPRGYSLASRQFTSKSGYIPKSEPEILNKLGITAEIWFDTVDEYNKGYHQFVGSEPELKEVCESLNIKWLSGIKKSRQLYLS